MAQPPPPPPQPPSQPPGTPPNAPPVVPGGRPGEPGYGYPQQPPRQPRQPYPTPYPSPAPADGGGFGAAAAPGPYVTGGSGFVPPPPAPPPPPAGPTPPRRGRSRSPAALVLAVVAALALLGSAGGVVILLTGDDGGSAAADGASPEPEAPLPTEPISATLAWNLPAPHVPPGENRIGARGAWFAGDAFVRAMDDSLVSYDLATGAENWSLPFELSGGTCLASPNVSENRVALLHGPGCEELTVVDIAAGQEVMTLPIRSEWPTANGGSYPAILGDTVAVGTGTASMGFSIGEQRMIWESNAADDCRETEFTVIDTALVSKLVCGSGDDGDGGGDGGGSIRATDAAGDELWEWEFEATYQDRPLAVESVISADPLVVTATVGDGPAGEGTSRIFVIDENHRAVAQEIDFDAEHHMMPCEVTVFANCWLGVVEEGFLYLPSNVPWGDNAVVAFDLRTGRARYEVPAINGGQIWPFGVQDGKVLAYQPADATLEGMVVAIDPATEEASPVMALDRNAREQEAALMGGFLIHSQRPLWHAATNSLVLTSLAFNAGDVANRPAALVYHS